MAKTEPLYPKAEYIQHVKVTLKGKRPRLTAALNLASNALFHQKDRYGGDYAKHYLRVAMHAPTQSETKQIIDILHDVVEDSDYTVDDLREMGYAERIVNGVDGMTKKEGELYFDFIERCSLNPDSVDGKISDLHDNMSLWRNEELMKPKEIEKTNVYIISNQYLIAIKKKQIAPGTKMTDFLENKPGLFSAALLKKHSSHPVPV